MVACRTRPSTVFGQLRIIYQFKMVAYMALSSHQYFSQLVVHVLSQWKDARRSARVIMASKNKIRMVGSLDMATIRLTTRTGNSKQYSLFMENSVFYSEPVLKIYVKQCKIIQCSGLRAEKHSEQLQESSEIKESPRNTGGTQRLPCEAAYEEGQ